jgi:uncharacterized protein YjbI with pentapeptide repeats
MAEEKGKQPWTLREFGGKTVWDWLQLLIVPAVLSLITVAFALWQDIRQEQVEDRRAEVERELADQRTQDEALQAYLDQMSGLLLEKDLRASKEDSEVRTLARARTLTVLGRLSPSRNGALMRFLEEAKLVQSVDGREPIISLQGAELSGTNLIRAALNGADLGAADLHDTDLSTAHLNNAQLGMANLSGADLTTADLLDARLGSTNLRDANLRDADLSGADLSYADLLDAQGVTKDQLEQQAATLEGATMPDGSVHP